MELFTTLTLAHLLADFPLQTNAIAVSKTKSIPGLLNHVFIHTSVLWALLGFSWRAWSIVLGVGIAHLIIDWIKPKVRFTNPARAFVIDQLAHLVSISAVSYLANLGYSVLPHATLSHHLLYPSLLISLGLATMVYLWVWTNSLSNEMVEQSAHLRWSRARLLEIEQRAGFGLICFIGISKFLMH